MSIPRAIGWGAGLAGLAGGALWLAENVNLPLANVPPAVIDPAPVALSSTAPGLNAPVITAIPAEADLETRLIRLEAQVRTLTQQFGVQQQGLNRSREDLVRRVHALEQQRIVASDEAATREDPPSPEAERAAVEARMALLDQQARTERADPRWSGPATTQIQGLFAEDSLAGSTLRDATCQTTLCRIEVDHRDTLALDRFLSELPARLGWNTDSYAQTVTHGDGSTTLVLYLSRDGYPLPWPRA
ncbi:MAG: hypothetical protein RKR03_20530 [Candidatus Competibacter sp.]|nr:hypothetical protein [Candidatus Competibacter sp.]MDS4058944.1 hypothetical protein [Candidatus Contendobacter sp.]